jgi:alkaline ceramidase
LLLQVSNILFFVIPPILIWLFRPYAEHVKSGINVVWLLLVVVGLGSVYFHATLSLVGQLLDEIAIIWVVLAAMCIWYPKHHFPAFCGQNR